MKVEISEFSINGKVFTLLEEIKHEEITVPKGYSSDGASVPRFLWGTVFPPGDNMALKPAFLHDYVYENHPDGWDRKKADRMFLDELIKAGIPKTRAYIAYIGVRLFGGTHWELCYDGVEK